ncbi:MAG TPA: class II fructose-bisphosphatase [Anaerolineales bacterium]|nr:class II fructose-bisphosphatase [Anaerolineales bacterium]
MLTPESSSFHPAVKQSDPHSEQPERNLALELVRVTEAAAMAAGRFMGRNDKPAADQAAVNAMRLVLNSVEMDGIVVIGEGEKDQAPMLYNGERLGTGRPPELDIAVDPIDGTRLLALGRANSLATVAISDRHTMWNPGPFVYMNKIAVGPAGKGMIDIEAPPSVNLRSVARVKGCDVRDLTVVILDRDRHIDLIAEVRKAGARIRLITDGDVAGALMTAWPDSGIDLLMGVGGTPEGVISACALKCMGGEIQGKIYSRNQDELDRGKALGYDLSKVFAIDDLVSSDNVFFAATGITDGELFDGVKYFGSGARTHSLVMRSKSGTVREIIARHRLDKLMHYSAVAFD